MCVIKYLRLTGFCLPFVFLVQVCQAAEQLQSWNAMTIVGSFAQGQYLFLLQPDVRFSLKGNGGFRQNINRFGIGRAIGDSVELWLGYDFVIGEADVTGLTSYTHRIWQQLIWQAINYHQFVLIWRSRLEQRWRQGGSGLSLRFRQRWQVFLPPIIKGLQLTFFDEYFVNIVRPDWVDVKAFSQNRLFAGIAINFTANSTLIFGYLNQHLNRRVGVDQNHVIYTELQLGFNA